MSQENFKKPTCLRERLHEIIYEADTPAGKLFDLALIACILLSVLIIMLDSVKRINVNYGSLFYMMEWIFTIIFSIEYILRVVCIKKPRHYIFSFFGIIDLLSILPTYLSFFFSGQTHFLAIIRILRVLRIFRILKLAQFLQEANILSTALHNSKRKIFIFFCSVLVMVTILGSCMYIIESPTNPNAFSSIPHSIYWAIVTITTVGYGDLAPTTDLGRFLASVVMLMGYAIIAVPSGIVTVELNEAMKNPKKINTQACPGCAKDDHDNNACFCKHCGEKL